MAQEKIHFSWLSYDPIANEDQLLLASRESLVAVSLSNPKDEYVERQGENSEVRAAERDEKKNSTNASTDAPAMLLCRKRPDGFTSLSCRSLQWRSSPHSTADTEDLPSNSAVESLLP